MKIRRWILLLAAALILSACSSSQPVPTAASRSGETLPNKPAGESASSGIPLSTRAAETEAPETSPLQTETEAGAPESSEAETIAEPETEPGKEPFVTPDLYTGKTYSVGRFWYGTEEGEEYVMDEEGHLLDAKKIPSPIYDALTGEVRFYDRTEYTKIGENYEDVKVSTILYDKDGTVLEEDVPYLFTYACGNCLVRLDSRAALMWEGQFTDYSGDLYDPYAHQVIQKDVCSVEKLTESSALAEDAHGYLLGVVDGTGKVLEGFPLETGPYQWPYVYGNGFVVADTEDGADGGIVQVLLNRDLEYVDHADEGEQYGTFNCGKRGIILEKILEDGTTWLFDLDKWEVILTLDDMARDMDEQRIICGEDGAKLLYDWNGNILAGPYEELCPIREDLGDPWQGLVGMNGNTVCRLDLDGKILNKVEISGLSYISVYSGIVYCSYEKYDSQTGYFGYGTKICDYELKQLIPDGYDNISRIAPGIYACPVTTPQGESRQNLFNSAGEMIFSGATSVGYGDEHAIPVVKGFSVGLIDLQGNWIAKNNRYEQEPGD